MEVPYWHRGPVCLHKDLVAVHRHVLGSIVFANRIENGYRKSETQIKEMYRDNSGQVNGFIFRENTVILIFATGQNGDQLL